MQPAGPELLDIHLPPAPSWWPPAPGWWLLALALLVLLIVAWLSGRRWYRRRAMRRAFEQELRTVELDHAGSDRAAARVAALSVLLRRIMAHHAPAAQRLRDEAWLRFLDGEDPRRPFSSGVGRLLLDAPYRPTLPEADAVALVALVRASLPRWTRPGHA